MSRLGELIAPSRMGRDFRWLVASFWTSNIGDGVALAAAPLLIASMTSSPVLVAMGAMMQFLPGCCSVCTPARSPTASTAAAW